MNHDERVYHHLYVESKSPLENAERIAALEELTEGLQAENAKLRDLLGRGAARPIVVADDGTDGATGSCRCGACGQPIDPWDRWCRHCGTEVER